MEFIDGRPPESEGDWRRVADYLHRLHDATAHWPQRPGWSSSVDLLTRDTGTSVDLTALPDDGVARCRAAWAPFADAAQVVVHGDPNADNIRIHDNGRIALIDWDESRVDVPVLDLVLPFNAAGLARDELRRAKRACSAWEAAVCWEVEPDYARRRLEELVAP